MLNLIQIVIQIVEIGFMEQSSMMSSLVRKVSCSNPKTPELMATINDSFFFIDLAQHNRRRTNKGILQSCGIDGLDDTFGVCIGC